MSSVTVLPQTLEAILNRYAPQLEACRDLIIADLQKTPGTAVLAESLWPPLPLASNHAR
jgi:hypothetical protein